MSQQRSPLSPDDERVRKIPLPAAPGPIAHTVRVVLVGLFLASCGAATVGVDHAHAQATTERDFSVPAGPLGTVLSSFAAAADITLSFASEQTRGRDSPGLSGRYTVEAGLAHLLDGSGLEAVHRGAGNYVLRERPASTASGAPANATTLPPVTVTATAEPTHAALGSMRRSVASGALGDRSQLDTPFSTTVITAEQLEARQVASVTDAFVHDPSVSNENATYTIWATQLAVRGLGLDMSSGYKVNGLPVYGTGLDIPYEHLESIQLLKGATGFMYGFGAPGGIADFVTRKPGREAARSVDVGLRSDSIWSAHADIGSRFTADDRFGLRINATHEEGRTYNDGSLRRDAFTLALASNLTSSLKWSFDLLHQERHTSGESSALSTSRYTGSVLPGAISSRDARLAIGGIYNDTRLTLASTGLEYRISADWKLTGRLAHSDVTAIYVKDFNYLLNPAGDYDSNLLGQKNKGGYGIGQLMLEGRFKTGAATHQVVLGAERQRLRFDASRNGFYRPVGAGNIHVPNPYAYTDGDVGWSMYRSAEYDQSAFFVSDTLTLPGNWSMIAGIRYNDYEQTGYTAAGAVSSSYEKSVLTPTLALLYKPVESVTLYGSYVESLEPGGIVAQQYANANEVLKPLKSKQYEIGVKAETDRWSVSAAVFRIERAAAYASADNYYVQNGLTTYQGAELNAGVRPVRNWTIGGGLMLLDAEYRRGTAFDGNRVVTAPRVVATAHTGYEVPQLPGLGLHANVKYVGDTYPDSANRLRVGGRAIFGMGASYTSRIANRPVTWRAEISNLTNRQTWFSSGNGQILPLLPRMFMLNAKMEF
ncbi:MAG: TonB-dependent receptor [Burkholderiaceae bacterium]